VILITFPVQHVDTIDAIRTVVLVQKVPTNKRDWSSVVKLACGAVSNEEDQCCLVMSASLAEFIDSTNVISTTWPRAAAVGERLWSAIDVTDVNAATPRLEEHRCRYLKRGIPAAPSSGPSFCEYEYNG
jgi:hypothetical protein